MIPLIVLLVLLGIAWFQRNKISSDISLIEQTEELSIADAQASADGKVGDKSSLPWHQKLLALEWLGWNEIVILFSFLLFHLSVYFYSPPWWKVHFGSSGTWNIWALQAVLCIFLLMTSRGNSSTIRGVGWSGVGVVFLFIFLTIAGKSGGGSSGQGANPYNQEFDIVVGPEWTEPIEFPKNLWADVNIDKPMKALGNIGEPFDIEPNVKAEHPRFDSIRFRMTDKKAGNGKVHFTFHK